MFTFAKVVKKIAPFICKGAIYIVLSLNMLSKEDANHYNQNKKQVCYQYTRGHSRVQR